MNSKINAYTAKSAENKLYAYLLQLPREKNTVVLPTDMSTLAKMIGIGRATLYRAFEKLEFSGLIIKNDKNISDQLESFENPSEEIKWFVDRLIGYHGTRIHNSFIKSLNIIAARIPAQNQQSFMGMEI